MFGIVRSSALRSVKLGHEAALLRYLLQKHPSAPSNANDEGWVGERIHFERSDERGR